MRGDGEQNRMPWREVRVWRSFFITGRSFTDYKSYCQREMLAGSHTEVWSSGLALCLRTLCMGEVLQ